jgi:hypothetical protein
MSERLGAYVEYLVEYEIAVTGDWVRLHEHKTRADAEVFASHYANDERCRVRIVRRFTEEFIQKVIEPAAEPGGGVEER